MLTRSKRIELVERQIKEFTEATERTKLKLTTRGPCPRIDATQHTLVSKLLDGLYGYVYRATDETGRTVVLKVKSKALLLHDDQAYAFAINEKHFAWNVDNQFIVKCFGTWTTTDFIVLILEYAPCGSFWNIIDSNNPMPLEQAVYYFAQMICGLQYLHASNIIFGNMSVESCLIFEKGRLKLSNFGDARFGLDQGIQGIGYLHYAAPEIILENASYTEMVDWWAFGCLVHMVLLNSYPFCDTVGDDRDIVAERLKQPDPLDIPRLNTGKLSGGAKDLIRKCLIKDTSKRLGKGGADQVMKHEVFRDLDFAWIKSDDFVNPGHIAKAFDGQPCDPYLLKFNAPDPREDEFKDY